MVAQLDAIVVPDATEEPQKYRAALLALVGDRDPVEIVKQTTRRIKELVAGRDPSDLERRPAPDEWSAADLIGHFLDAEVVLGFRWRMILSADRPAYPGYDQDRWAALPKPPLDQRWPILEALRTYNHWLIGAIPREDWQRVGLHSEVGPERLEDTIRAYAGHDLVHLNQLERALGG